MKHWLTFLPSSGFTFFNLGFSIQDMQNRMFTSFLILTIPPTVVNAVVPKFFTARISKEKLWRRLGYCPLCDIFLSCHICKTIC